MTELSPQTEVSPEISRFDAENATNHVGDFLKRLGYNYSWLPMKVSLDGELFVVEMKFHKKTAKVQINSKTKEIKEYEFAEEEGSGGGPKISRGKLIFFIVIVSVAVVASKLLGVF